MDASYRRFEVNQATETFPKTIWPYLALLFLGYYLSVVFEFQLLFTGFVLLLLGGLVIRVRAASRCILWANQEQLKVEYAKGFLGLNMVEVEYFWKDMDCYIWKTPAQSSPELQIKWQIWDDSHYFGKDSEGFRDLLRSYFADKECI